MAATESFHDYSYGHDHNELKDYDHSKHDYKGYGIGYGHSYDKHDHKGYV